MGYHRTSRLPGAPPRIPEINMTDHDHRLAFYALGLDTGSAELDTQYINAEWLLAEARDALETALECGSDRDTIAWLRADLAEIEAAANFVADTVIGWQQADRSVTAH